MMNPIERNARAVLAKLYEWRGETFAVTGNMLLSATGLTAEDVNDAVELLKEWGAAETIDYLGTYPYKFGEVRITSRGKYLYHEHSSNSPSQSSDGQRVTSTECDYDCFICHASEDKARFVDGLARQLRDKGCKVWYDDFVLKVGDSLRGKIDEGLLRSRHGVVVLSPAFFRKDWPQKELDGLAALARERGILPVWLDVTKEDIVRFSPTLADIKAAKAPDGFDVVVRALVDTMGKLSSTVSAPTAGGCVVPASQLTEQEAELLVAAARDGNLYLCKAANAPTWVRAGKRNLVHKTDLAIAAQYVDALETLVSKGYARHEGGMLYVLTGSGFAAARATAERDERSRCVTGGELPPRDIGATESHDVIEDKGTTCLRGRDHRGPVSATRFQLPKQGGPPAVVLDVIGDGREATVTVYFHQTAWAVKIESHGSVTEFELPIRTDAHQEGTAVWVELAAAYLTSDEKPVFIVKTQVDAAHGDRVCVYDVLLKAGGVSTDRLLDAEVGWGGSPVVLMPNRIEIRHCCHPESKLAGYTWMSGRFVADPADTAGEW